MAKLGLCDMKTSRGDRKTSIVSHYSLLLCVENRTLYRNIFHHFIGCYTWDEALLFLCYGGPAHKLQISG